MIRGRVLVVGCGGIGCELLKLLATKNLESITLIDCDNVDLSNLNRQFFFGRKDIGKSKAIVAAKVFRKMNKKCKVFPICADITEFDARFFAEYETVYSCLDSIEVRSYVNQRCFISKTPLVDGGSGGFKGQAYYFDYNSECFDCIPKRISREHLVCTIRSRPTSFEHCISWAKYVFLEMKLKVDGEQDFYPRHLKDIIENCEDMSTPGELEKFRSSEDYKEKTKKIVEILGSSDLISFDKDKRDVLEYIYNVAYIRGMCAGIKPLSFDDAVTIAGNIIPSLSTINSIIASLMILSVKNKCNYYCVDNGNIIRKLETCERNPGCRTCSYHWYGVLYDGTLTFKRLMECFETRNLKLIAYSDKRLFFTPDMAEYLDKDIEFENNNIAEVVCMGRRKRKIRVFLYFLRRGETLYFGRIHRVVYGRRRK
ncbi:SUMO ubiquitin activating enzyme E1 subunit UBA2 [Encephalitozoon intestinalis ATCC 50506]|uniref:SUMO ubiquitin activating enzyme E1 subunit UBA2 n=1 Tax=Encephalitozoon intestinalis (strain ATCC 50506) TaxID=876142 RepID=E0S5Z2_ENCIT|nr:SUMO ubiquitin activating enzyme E1 subunit UBA2 [Encephalitozoon intestinalis ATCC 50506]ADM11127.1 SUMO ubiquitin activating enzyme E1 subunit UBA2 [Encephalitozoon intestinalis ATCC 50506]UTX44781.1 sumo-activating enzyme enzyme subunit 2 [Encephalitozoon intestinalis]